MFLGRIALFPIPGLKDIPTRNTSIATTSTDNENLSLNPLVISYQDEDEVHFDSFTSCKISSILTGASEQGGPGGARPPLELGIHEIKI